MSRPTDSELDEAADVGRVGCLMPTGDASVEGDVEPYEADED